VAQSPTPYPQNGKKYLIFCRLGVGGNAQKKKRKRLNNGSNSTAYQYFVVCVGLFLAILSIGGD